MHIIIIIITIIRRSGGINKYNAHVYNDKNSKMSLAELITVVISL